MYTANIPALDVRQHLGELLERVYYQAHQYRIVRKDKAMARLVSEPLMQALDELMERDSGLADTLAIMTNPEVKAGIEKSRRAFAAGERLLIADALK